MISRTPDGKFIYPKKFELIERERVIKEGSALSKLNEAIINYNNAASEAERPLLYLAIDELVTTILSNENTLDDTRQSINQWNFLNYFKNLLSNDSSSLVETRISEGVANEAFTVSTDVGITKISRGNYGVCDVYQLSLKNKVGETSYAILKVYSPIRNEMGEFLSDKDYQNFIFNITEARRRLDTDADKIFGKIEAMHIVRDENGKEKGRIELIKHYPNKTLANFIQSEKNQTDQDRLGNTVNYLIQLLTIDKKLRKNNIMYYDMKLDNNNLDDEMEIRLLDCKSVVIVDGITHANYKDIRAISTVSTLPIDWQTKLENGVFIHQEEAPIDVLRATPIGIAGYSIMQPEKVLNGQYNDFTDFSAGIFNSVNKNGTSIKTIITKLLDPTVTAQDMDKCLDELKVFRAELKLDRQLKHSSGSFLRSNSSSPYSTSTPSLYRSRSNKGKNVVMASPKGREDSNLASSSTSTFFKKSSLRKCHSSDNIMPKSNNKMRSSSNK